MLNLNNNTMLSSNVIIGLIGISIFAFLIPFCFFWIFTGKLFKSLLLGIIIGVGTFFTLHYSTKKCNQNRQREFENGETITTLIKRVEHGRTLVYLLTEDNQTFSEVCCVNYKMLLPGDTLIYQRSTKGKTRIVDVRYTANENIQGYLKKMEEYAAGY